MANGTLEQIVEFSLDGVELQSGTTLEVPDLQLTAQLEPGAALRLTVRVRNAPEDQAVHRVNRVVQELYHRLLLRFAPSIELATPPRAVHHSFTPTGAAPVTRSLATIAGRASIVSPQLALSQADIDAVVREVELRVTTPEPPTSAQLYTAIAMYTAGLELQDRVVRFLVLYSALALAALFRWHDGKQGNVDRLLLERNPKLSVSPSPRNPQGTETLYTKLRNDLIHAEERGCDPTAAIAAIEANAYQFQLDVSLVFANL